MWLCEDKLKGEKAHFRLPSASQKRALLSSLITIGSFSNDDGNGNENVVVKLYVKNKGLDGIELPDLCKIIAVVYQFSYQANQQDSTGILSILLTDWHSLLLCQLRELDDIFRQKYPRTQLFG